MFPQSLPEVLGEPGFLHARGDVSSVHNTAGGNLRFSPRTWRCFALHQKEQHQNVVFSTHVEMFLIQDCWHFGIARFLHARGDVSDLAKKAMSELRFSPRTGRCFLIDDGKYEAASVFSTHVEMFLFQIQIRHHLPCFLHARGDVSF